MVRFSLIRFYGICFLLFLISGLFIKFIFAFHIGFAEHTFAQIISAIFWGARFDLALSAAAAFLITLVSVLSYRVSVYCLVVLLGYISSVQVADIMYFAESGRHMGYELADLVTDFTSLLFTGLTQFTLLFVSGVTAVLTLSYYLNKKFQSNKENFKRPSWYSATLQLIVCLIIGIFFFRGGTQVIPLEPIHVYEIGQPSLAKYAMNGSYNAIYETVKGSRKLKKLKLPVISVQQKYQSLAELYMDREAKDTQLKNKNVVVVLLESWSASLMNSYGYEKVSTPFFDQLRKKALSSAGMIAGGKRTTEGIFASFCSYPNPLGKTIAQSSLQNFEYLCLPEVLKQHGYKTAFFQGSLKQTSGTGAFAQKLGFLDSFGNKDIDEIKVQKNYWGVHDPDLYNFVLKKVKSYKEPFFIAVNTNSTHDLHLPPEVAYKFGSSSGIEKKLSVLHYADSALKGFVESLLHLYPDTVLVLVSDHTSGLSGDPLEEFMVPYLIYEKGIQPQMLEPVISQRDIAPTILDYLGGYSHLAPHFTGKSLISDKIFFADFYYNGQLGWVSKDRAWLIDPISGKGKSYQFTRNPFHLIAESERNEDNPQALSFFNHSQELLFLGLTMDYHKIFNTHPN